jgi:hypothetical protein
MGLPLEHLKSDRFFSSRMEWIRLMRQSLMISITVEQMISRVDNSSFYVIRMFYRVCSVLQWDLGTQKSSQLITRLISSNSGCDVSVIL